MIIPRRTRIVASSRPETYNLRSIQSGFIFLETCECSCSAQAFSRSGRRQKPHFITLEPPTSQFHQRTIHLIILSFSMIFSISKNVKTTTKKELLIDFSTTIKNAGFLTIIFKSGQSLVINGLYYIIQFRV